MYLLTPGYHQQLYILRDTKWSWIVSCLFAIAAVTFQSQSIDQVHWNWIISVFSLTAIGLFATWLLNKQISQAKTPLTYLPVLYVVSFALVILWSYYAVIVDHLMLLPLLCMFNLIFLYPSLLQSITTLCISAIAPFIIANQLNLSIEVNFLSFLGILSLGFSIAIRSFLISQSAISRAMELKLVNEQLNQSQALLENRVADRTAQINAQNQRLQEELGIKQQLLENLSQHQMQLEMAISASNLEVWQWDVINEKMEHQGELGFHYKTNNKSPLPDHHIINEQDYPICQNLLMEHLAGKSELFLARYRIWNEEKQAWHWIEDQAKSMEFKENRVTKLIGTRRDITKQMHIQKDLRLSASLFENSLEGVFVLDNQFNFKTVNSAFEKMTGYSKQELIDMPYESVSANQQKSQIQSILIQSGVWKGEVLERRKNQELYPLQMNINAVFDNNHQIKHFLGIARDLTEPKKAEMQIDFLNNYDKLTGLFNRAYFHQQLDNNAKIVNEQNLALCVVNLDRFKSINESLGFSVGDQVLQDAAARLNNLKIEHMHLSRLSGDEFGLLINVEDTNDHSALDLALSVILSELARPYFIDEHELIVTCSIGVTIITPTNKHHNLNQATTALNLARHQGGNNFKFYDASLKSSPIRRMELEKSLRKAISCNELSVSFQPKMRLQDNNIHSVEALVRWHHPHKGLIPPEEFIPIAEQTGLIANIGEQVLYKACSEAAAWRARGFGDISVAVNLSSHQIRRNNIFEVVADALHSSGLPPHLLELELTESMIMEDAEHSRSILNRLHALGVKIALDDFGTGYSSLSYLRQFPIDTLKIDRSFLEDARRGQSSAIIEAIIAMAQSLKMNVVAEGIETQAQVEYLTQLGCDYAQGFLISKALPSSEIIPLIRHYNLKQNLTEIENIH